jgi:hypothetical protein
MPLEPITEEDLNLESKFGKVEAEKSFEAKETLPKTEEEPAKEIISAEKDSAYNKILSKIKTSAAGDTNDEEIKSDAQEAIEKQDAESQIQHLVDIAQTKGVIHAVKVAKHLEDNYILDMFHDRLLSDELHDALLSKGLIDGSL